MSRCLPGNSGVPQSANTSSISWGISPASSLARNSAWPASARSTRCHCGMVSGSTWIRTLYGFGRDPCTWAVTYPGEMSKLSTWPRRA